MSERIVCRLSLTIFPSSSLARAFFAFEEGFSAVEAVATVNFAGAGDCRARGLGLARVERDGELDTRASDGVGWS